jgi:uncharacterized protein YciI
MIKLNRPANHPLGQRLAAVHDADGNLQTSTVALDAADAFEVYCSRFDVQIHQPQDLEALRPYVQSNILPACGSTVIRDGTPRVRQIEAAAAEAAAEEKFQAERAHQAATARLQLPHDRVTSGRFMGATRAQVQQLADRMLDTKASRETGGDRRHLFVKPRLSIELGLICSMGATESLIILAPAANFSFYEAASWGRFAGLASVIFLVLWVLTTTIGRAIGDYNEQVDSAHELTSRSLSTQLRPVLPGTSRVNPTPQQLSGRLDMGLYLRTRRVAAGAVALGSVVAALYGYIIYSRVHMMTGRLSEWPAALSVALSLLVALLSLAGLGLLVYWEAQRSPLAEDSAAIEEVIADTAVRNQKLSTTGWVELAQSELMGNRVESLMTHAEQGKGDLYGLATEVALKFSYLVGFTETVVPDADKLPVHDPSQIELATQRHDDAMKIRQEVAKMLHTELDYTVTEALEPLGAVRTVDHDVPPNPTFIAGYRSGLMPALRRR